MDYTTLKVALAVVATIGLYSVLYRENKFYRFWEHVFLGLAAGWSLVALWTDTLKGAWWDKMVGAHTLSNAQETRGYWAYALLLPIGMMGYFVFSKKHNWISRVPIGIILGLYSGQQFQAWQNRYVPLIDNAIQPVFPTTAAFFKPGTVGMAKDQAALVNSQVYGSEALNHIIMLVTTISVLTYFLFSFDVKNRFVLGISTTGRWLLMIGFGAIFGTTGAMRITLLIDRMYFVWVEFVTQKLLHR